MSGLRLVRPLGKIPPAPPPPASAPQPPARRGCDCGVLPHRCWCPDKVAYDRTYNAQVEAAARLRGLPR